MIERNRSKQVELLSWIYNHVTHRMVKGFNMLTLGWTDGYSFVPAAFNMMASADHGKHITGAASGIDRRKSGYKRRQEAVCHKPDAAIAMIRNALKAGIQASYILMDTWFTNEPFINNILGEGLNVIGMLKDNKQLYRYHGRFYNLKALSYDMTVSSTAIVFTRYILLEWLRRKANDPKTICELFYVCCDDIPDIELCTALSNLVSIFMERLRTEAIKITNAIKMQLIDWFVSQPAFIKAFFPELMREVWKNKSIIYDKCTNIKYIKTKIYLDLASQT